MEHKKLLISLTIVNCVAVATALLLFNAKPTLFVGAGADTKSYRIEFNEDKNKISTSSGSGTYSGDAYLATNLGNEKEFNCDKIKSADSSWQILADGGYFYNVSPIYGIQNISLTFLTSGADYTISYSKDNSFNKTQTFTTPEDGSAQAYSFDSFQPSYFKITNTSGSDLNISSIVIDFSCLNNYPTLTLINENEDMGYVLGSGIKNAGEYVTIKARPYDGYKFVGWYEGDGTLFSSSYECTFGMSHDDVTYYAKFAKERYWLNVTSKNDEYGTVTGDGKYDYQEEVTITATALNECTFIGWYDADDKFVSKANPYTFNMPASEVSYVAKFMTQEETEKWNKDHGLIPVEDTATKTVTYGLYPQNYVDDSSLVAELNKLDETAIDEKNGYYFYDNEYYVKTKANLYIDSFTNPYTFHDGTSIKNKTDYWFKCEPIKWKILNSSRYFEYSLVSTVLLDRQIFHNYYNDYETSYIRNWLNGTDEDIYEDSFFRSAFGLDSSYLKLTSATTDDAKEIASDYVYLLSQKNYQNSADFYYGDVETKTRLCEVTDYAIANYAYYDEDTRAGFYWTRTPRPQDSDDVVRVNQFGAIDYDVCVDDNVCVRPGISIDPQTK